MNEIIEELVKQIAALEKRLEYLETVELLGGWTNYTATSTITGWSGTPTAKIYYKKIGNLMLVMFRISGTSDSVDTSFTVPYAANNVGTLDQLNPCFATDDGTPTIGYGQIPDNTSAIIFAQTPAGTGGWTASGTKNIIGQLWYEIA